MKLWNWIFGSGGEAGTAAPRAAIGDSYDVANIEDSHQLAEFLSTGLPTSTGEVVGTQEAMSVSAVYRSVNILSGIISNLPINIKDEQSLELQWNHPARKLLNRRPNSWQSGREFKKYLMNCTLLRGNGYAYKVRRGREVIALIPMRPGAVSVEQKPDNTLEYTFTAKDGRTRKLPQDEVFHVRGMSLDGVTGLSVIGYAREAIGYSRAAEKHGGAMFKNGTHLGSVLKHPQKLSAEAREGLKASLDAYRGADNAGKNLILEEGMDMQNLGMTASDAEFIENRKLSVLMIAMFFGVPPHLIGFTEKSTSWGSGIEQQSIGFVNYTLNDWFGAWEGAIERDLLNDDNLIADVDDTRLLRGDIATRSTALNAYVLNGIFNPDEARAFEGKPRRADGKGDKYYDPPNTAGQPGDPSRQRRPRPEEDEE